MKFVSQSQNASAKMALCVDEISLNDFEFKRRKNHDWNQLDEPLFTTHESFVFFDFSFYFRMLKKTIDKLIDTGVMKHLVDNHYLMRKKFGKTQKGPKVLNMNDLSFGFNIWLGFCLISIAAFVAEKIFKLTRKPREIKFAKVHPIGSKHELRAKTKPETFKKFRICKNLPEISRNNENKITIQVDVHQSMDSCNSKVQLRKLNGSSSQNKTEDLSVETSENFDPKPQDLTLFEKFRPESAEDEIDNISLLETVEM